MKIDLQENTVSIYGNIISASDFDAIKNTLEPLKNERLIVLKIYDSLVINSSIIGYLMKLTKQEGVAITLYTGQEILYELLEDLGLIETFSVKKL